MSTLEEIKGRLEAATPGPWRTGGSGVVAGREYVTEGVRTDADADFIANSPETQAKLIAALEAVEVQHPREVLDVHEGYGAETWCPSCRVHWPCPTAKAITEALA